MAFISIDDFRAGHKEITPSDQVAILDSQGKIKIGTVKIKRVKQEGWSKSKMKFNMYAYAQYRDGEKVKQKYIGVLIPGSNTIYKKR